MPNILTPRHILSLLSKRLPITLKNLSREIIYSYNKAHHHINGWDPVHFVTLASSVGFLLDEYIPAEGLPFFKYYLKLNIKRLRNFSYTMIFKFKKIKDKIININE